MPGMGAVISLMIDLFARVADAGIGAECRKYAVSGHSRELPLP